MLIGCIYLETTCIYVSHKVNFSIPHHIYIYIYIYNSCFTFAQSAGTVEYTDCFSGEGYDPSPNECPGYDTKQSDGEVPAMLELWGMQSTPLLPSLLGPLWHGVVAPDKSPIYRLNRTNSILMPN